MKFSNLLLILIINTNYCHFQLIGSIGKCLSKIFCHGELLHTVQMSGMFRDSKTFVDMPTRYSEIQVLHKFSLIDRTNFTELQQFIEDNFLPSGSDIVTAELIDWHQPLSFLTRIKNFNLRHLANSLHSRWRKLAKKFDDTNLCSRCKTSAFLTQNAFIVPGGRFIEYYYWDTYWIVEALLISGMTQTAKGILLNFFDILQLNGFIPNGAQIYYLNRSQPPLLIHMAYAYYKHTSDIEFLKNNINFLDKEYEFWMNYKSIDVFKNGEKFTLNQYRVVSDRPRPESYKEDYLNGQESGNASQYYSNVMSAAESGWDFSSRWFKDPMDIRTIFIDKIVPVDLNSILYRNEKILQEFHLLLSNEQKANKYKNLADLRHKAINSVFWDPVVKTYGDYNYEMDKVQTKYLYVTDLAPLWFNVTPPVDDEHLLKRYKSILFDFVSGIPASNINTHQQWDFPNVWAPYHHWTVDYLIRSNRASQALNIAQRFVNTVYCGWKKTSNFYEKYNANEEGKFGYGGEYVVQEGFGWTNAVVVILMNRFGHSLHTFC